MKQTIFSKPNKGNVIHSGNTPVSTMSLDKLTAERRHILDLDNFSEEEICSVLEDAETMSGILHRSIKKVPALRGKTIATLFTEPSTRTRASFEQAAKLLSADIINVSKDDSSAKKGESLYNTALTLRAMKVDAIVIRHPHPGAPYMLAKHLDCPVINAGDGAHAHPTQALLDLFTIKSCLGKIKGAKVVIVGDILHSRVARSNLWGLTIMGAQVVLCAPPTLIPSDLLGVGQRAPQHPFASVEIEPNIEHAFKSADVIMALRIQSERQLAGHLPSLRDYSKMYSVASRHLKIANDDVIVMHPGPMNEGVEIESSVAHGPKSVIEKQVTNGLAIRMAILYRTLTTSQT